MKKSVALFMTIIILCSAAGCAGKENFKPASSDAVQSDAASDTASNSESEAIPEPDDNPAVAEALRIAREHGLSDDELRGEYELFIRFSETLEGNSDLGSYKDFTYRIFTVVAAASDFIEPDFFFDRLSELVICEGELESGLAGIYNNVDNSVTINTEIDPADAYHVPEVVFHELMHFVDFNVDNNPSAMYLHNGRRLLPYELDGMSPEEMDELILCSEPEVVTEGGAEYITAKYFSGATRAYFIPSQFLAGIEYIHGEEKLNELFFGRDSDAIFAELLLDAGYSKEKYFSAVETLNWLTYPDSHENPSDYVAPEDILIDLYEHKLGDGWKTDEAFLYILKAINGVTGTDYKYSKHSGFLKGVEFNTWEQYNAFIEKLYGDFPELPQLRYLPPVPVIRDGSLMLGAFAEWTDADTKKTIRGTITVDYDFDAEKLLGCETIDMDEIVSRYFG